MEFPGLLPAFTTADLERCRTHRSTTVPIACVNIANPATGSSSLERAFVVHPAFANYSYRRRRALFSAGSMRMKKKDIPQNLMHSHAFGVKELKRFLRKKRLPEPRCYVMTIRDPAERLQSAFRESYLHAERLSRSLWHLPKSNRTASTLVRQIRNGGRCGRCETCHTCSV